MEYFFLLSLVKTDRNVNDTIDEIVYLIKGEQNKWFPKIGIVQKTDTAGYGYGEQSNLMSVLSNFSKKIPYVTLAFYHIYWNGEQLCIYTVRNGIVDRDKIDLYGIPVGKYNITPKIHIKNFEIPNNLSIYFNPNYYFKYIAQTEYY